MRLLFSVAFATLAVVHNELLALWSEPWARDWISDPTPDLLPLSGCYSFCGRKFTIYTYAKCNGNCKWELGASTGGQKDIMESVPGAGDKGFHGAWEMAYTLLFSMVYNKL